MRWPIALLLLASCSRTSVDTSGPPGLPFEKHTLDTAYRAEGVAIADLNNDGVPDIATDEYWFAGPSMTPNEVRAPQTYDPTTAFADGFGVYPQDVDGDGWLDLIVAPHPGNAMYWYANPHGASAHWLQHTIVESGVAGLETPIVADVFGSGTPVLVMTDSVLGVLAWFTPPADPTQLWTEHPISAVGYPGAPVYTHGIGVGDVNRDGKLDVITGYGWFEQTSDPAAWTDHAFAFGPNPNACSRMFAFDVDGDGLPDVLCSRPHDYGLHWLRQQSAPNGGDPTFVEQTIDDTLSQMHALRLDDLDGDGVPEIVSGKRYLAHLPPGDPGEGDPADLTYYALRRGPGGPTFTRHDIDGNSGVGSQFAIGDIDGNGKPDVAVSSKKGLFYFLQK